MMRYILYFLALSPSLVLASENVYCIHGFMRTESSMKPLQKALQKKGFEAKTWGYPSRDGTIEAHAQLLVDDLKKTASQNPSQPIHFVTHSLGGIILRKALNDPECPEEAKAGRSVLLVPPNKGSRFGRFLHKVKPLRKVVGPHAGSQLFHSDHFDRMGPFPPSMEVLVISGTFGWNPVIGEANDGKVGVSEACLDTPHKHMKVFCGHSWIMFSDQVKTNVALFLKCNSILDSEERDL